MFRFSIGAIKFIFSKLKDEIWGPLWLLPDGTVGSFRSPTSRTEVKNGTYTSFATFPPPPPKPSSREQGQIQTLVLFFLNYVHSFLDVVNVLINVREIIYALQCEQIGKRFLRLKFLFFYEENTNTSLSTRIEIDIDNINFINWTIKRYVIQYKYIISSRCNL